MNRGQVTSEVGHGMYEAGLLLQLPNVSQKGPGWDSTMEYYDHVSGLTVRTGI